MKKIILLLILFLGFLVRLYKVNAPLADWHSWRQADTAAVARNFVKYGYDLLHPRFDDLSNIPSGKDNPQGYRFVEFPIFNFIHAFLYQLINKLIQGVSFEMVGRMVSIFSSLGAAIFLYLIVKENLGRWLALLSMTVFLFLPYSIYYSRTILPEPMMVMLALGSVCFLRKFQISNSKSRIFLSILFGASSILVKPYAIFLLAPSWLVIFGSGFKKAGRKSLDTRYSILYTLISISPFLVWRWWMRQFPEGIPANRWLLNLGGIRFRPAWWRWLFAERLAKLILGYWGLIPLGIGLITKTGKKGSENLFYSWLGGIFAYLVIFARGNVQHDYYQIIALPAISVFVAKGVEFLLVAPKKYFYPVLPLALCFLSLLFSFGFSWYHVREYYKINRPEIVEVGKLADKILPKEARVIAPYNGDTAFLYQINRRGWPAMTYDLQRMKALGATHYVSVDFDQLTNELKQQCSVLNQTDKGIIISLENCQ